MKGSVTETTVEQDYATYTELSNRMFDSFAVKQLTYGELSNEFSSATGFRVNPTTKEIEFEYDESFALEEYRQFKRKEIMSWYEKDLVGNFTSALTNTDGINYEFLYDKDSQMKINGQTNKLNLMLSRLSLGQITQAQFEEYFPIPWRTANIGVVNLSYENYLVFADEVENHERSLLTKRLQKEGYVDSLTTKEEIEAVTW